MVESPLDAPPASGLLVPDVGGASDGADSTAIIHKIEIPTEPQNATSNEIVLLPDPPKKKKKLKTVRDKSMPIVKEVYNIILKRTKGNYRLIGRTIRMLYKVYLHHTQEKLKEPLAREQPIKEPSKIPTPKEA